MLGSCVPVRHPEEYEQSTIANFCFGSFRGGFGRAAHQEADGDDDTALG
jgi:hypothetical protein